ncbi:MAG: hypothetical protein B6U87_00760 [Candidatus Aenigmarchaeota archaeon ex4484_52]|nr:MAG: hypothetical protein B6U87_00760 [Candidatus Aenigmarchaeota archaeon ex4484_52]
MKIKASLFVFLVCLIVFVEFGFCEQEEKFLVSNSFVFPQLVTENGKIMVMAFIKTSSTLANYCDLTKEHSFYCIYNYTTAELKKNLTEMEFVYPNPTKDPLYKPYSVEIDAEGDGNITFFVNCFDRSLTAILENKTFEIKTGNLKFTYDEEEFLFKNKIKENITLYPYSSIIQKDSYDNQLTYSIYNLYTNSAIENKIFQKQLYVLYDKQENNFTYEAEYPIGYIVFVGDNETDLGGRFLKYAAIPFFFNLSVSKNNLIRGEKTTISADVENYYGDFLGDINGNIIFNGATKGSFILEKKNKYALNYSPKYGAGIYNFTTFVESDLGNSFIYSHPQKTISFKVVNKEYKVDITIGKTRYLEGDTLYLNATLLDKSKKIDSQKAEVKIKSESSICTHLIGKSKFGKTWLFSIPLDFNTSKYKNPYEIEVILFSNDGRKYSKNKAITITSINPTKFSLSPSILEFIFDGERQKKTIKISNTGAKDISQINASASEKIKHIVSFHPRSFSLNKTKSKNISVYINPSNLSKYTKIHEYIYFKAIGYEKRAIIEININLNYSAQLSDDNKTIEVLTKDKPVVILEIENTGKAILNNFSYSITGDELNKIFTNATIPKNISAGGKKHFYFYFNKTEEKTINGLIKIISNNIANTAKIKIIAIKDFSRSISELKLQQSDIGKKIEDITDEDLKDELIDNLTILQTKITELASDYSNKHYLRAKSKIDRIEEELNLFEDKVDEELEKQKSTPPSPPSISYCGDGTCDADENETSCIADCFEIKSYCGDGTCDADEDEFKCAEDCKTSSDNPIDETPKPKNKSIKIIIAVIALIIIILIAVTSIVPDSYEEGEKENEAK